mmetsp:Transcript_31232/g.43280  ORF Transcript_31232/g.43280 Transcript_31232/m.43280 type:complete len:127 (-) Transcript_31232:153-533(-)|eukprot:CAMPEP_0196576794 /NCGR_PEP_ID=MMETSP1081-20130531/5970_1 /TAXON_ID=36882 /ORGANISM="Pyramimonas amylifera, Strain CCMP720" /LENGTH=126 /DNA_ID=CAMNT_0041895495 /DNA_START=289 /DNA_END=669 /DNA_ORIENTATION=+
MSSYDNVVGGKLKLKGKALSVDPSLKKKKKKKNKVENCVGMSLEISEINEGGGEADEAGEGTPTPKEPIGDFRTDAEKRYDEQVMKVEENRIKKAAKLTHRDKVKQYNEYLTALSEHYDIPKVGPG